MKENRLRDFFKRKPKVPSLYRDLLAADSGNKAAKVLVYVVVGTIVIGFLVVWLIPQFSAQRIVFSNRNYFPAVW